MFSIIFFKITLLHAESVTSCKYAQDHVHYEMCMHMMNMIFNL